jgi:PAS domain S-box-containing protein/putative nucleotidyltransferase with HDIG domain
MDNRPIHILLIEDNRGYATVVHEMLARVMDIPYQFKHAERLTTGLKHLEKNETDVVLLDLGLPDSKGLDTFTKVYDYTPKVPIIVLTVNHNDALAVEAIKAGAQDYLVKGQFEGQVLGRAIQFAIERNRVEESLKGENVFLRYILDSPSPISVMYTDIERNILYWNEGAERMFGYKAEEVVGRQKIDILYPDDTTHKAVEDMRLSMLERKEEVDCEIREVTKDGRKIWVNLICVPRFDEKGNVIGILGIGEDITERRQTKQELQESFEKLQKTLDAMVNALASTVTIRDPYTANHQKQVTQLACAIAEEMGLTEQQVDWIRMAASVHDIGKINVPIEFLSKPGSLSHVEYDMVKTHPHVGYEILKTIEFPWTMVQAVLQHHERLDGSGYPQGLKGDEIILEARILGVADVVDAISSHRPYRAAFDIDKALEEIEKNKGTLYDTDVVDACLKLLKEKGFRLNNREVQAAISWGTILS